MGASALGDSRSFTLGSFESGLGGSGGGGGFSHASKKTATAPAASRMEIYARPVGKFLPPQAAGAPPRRIRCVFAAGQFLPRVVRHGSKQKDQDRQQAEDSHRYRPATQALALHATLHDLRYRLPLF